MKGAHGCNEQLPPLKPGTGVGAGAGSFGTETESDVYLSQVAHHLPLQLVVG